MDIELTQIKRSKNAVLDSDWIKDFLHKAPYAILATEYEGQPFAYGRLFVYSEEPTKSELGLIYLHGALHGRTRTNIEVNPRVCLTITEIGNILAAPTACAFDLQYRSVVVFGKAYVENDVQQAERGLNLLMEKYAPKHDYSPPNTLDLRKTLVYRLEIDAWSAKKHS